MARKISISFKETQKDIELYDYLMSLDDKSADIKAILRKTFKDRLLNKEQSYKKKEEINVMDF